MKKQILIYGVALALLALLMSSFRYFFFIREFSTEIFITSVALLFTGLGLWIGKKITSNPKISRLPFKPNEKAINYLGITDRELEVLQLVAEGCSNREIAGRLFVSVNTVKTHVSNILSKLDVNRRTQAIRKGKTLRLIP